jgi:hypothetical protein
LEVFDFAEQGMVTGSRDATTVASQALYLLNDPFVRREALALAAGLLARGETDDLERINRTYRLTLGRTATSRELERGLQYLADYELGTREVLTPTPSVPLGETAVAVADTQSATVSGSAETPAKKKKAPQNPDEADQSDDPIEEEPIQPASPQVAAWASFCQALLGSAEFRYLK